MVAWTPRVNGDSPGPAEVAILVEVGDVRRACTGRRSRCPRWSRSARAARARRRQPSGGWSPASARGPDRRSRGSLARSCLLRAATAYAITSSRSPSSTVSPGPTAIRSIAPRRAAPGPRSASSWPRRPGAAGRPSTGSPRDDRDGDHDAGDDRPDLDRPASDRVLAPAAGPLAQRRPGARARSSTSNAPAVDDDLAPNDAARSLRPGARRA